jgi:uncharacterized membrane protein
MKKASFAPYPMLVFAFLGAAIAFYDSYAIYNRLLLWCPPPIDGCNTVAYSPYGQFYGVPFGYLGLVYYLLMFVAAALLVFDPSSRGMRLGALLCAGVGVLSSLCFMYIDLVLIRAFCVYCAISAVLTLLLLILAVRHFRATADGCGLTVTGGQQLQV